MSSGNLSEMDRDRRDLSKGARQILTGFGARSIARILLIVFVAKLFGASVFGRLGETVAIIELTAAFASFGLTKTMLGEFARDDKVGRSIGLRLTESLILVSGVSLTIAGGLWAIWPVLFPTDAAPRIAVIGVPLIALTDVLLTATRHFRTVAWDTIVKAVIKPWSFLGFALLAHALLSGSLPFSQLQFPMSHLLIGAYLGSLFVSGVVALSVTYKMFRHDIRHSPRFEEIIGIAHRSFPIALNETGVFAFRRIDIILLGLVAGPSATGIYYLAQQIGTVVEKVRYLFEPMMAPIVAQSGSLETIGAHLKRLCIFIFTVQLGLLVFASLNGDDMMSWFGPGFAAGLGVLLLILLGELVDGSFGLSELPLVYRHPHWPPRAVLLVLIVECILVLFLARSYGAVGAAAGFAASMLVLAIFRLSLIWRYYKFQVLSRTYVGVILAALVSAAPALMITKLSSSIWTTFVAPSLVFIILYGSLTFLLLRRSEASVPAEPAKLKI